METTSAESGRLARHVLPRSAGQSDEHSAAPTSSFRSNKPYVVGLLVWDSYMHWGKGSFIVLHHKRIMSQLQSKGACKMPGSSSELRAWHMPVGIWSNFASNHDRALTPCLSTQAATLFIGSDDWCIESESRADTSSLFKR